MLYGPEAFTLIKSETLSQVNIIKPIHFTCVSLYLMVTVAKHVAFTALICFRKKQDGTV
jgi:hypothetical protein